MAIVIRTAYNNKDWRGPCDTPGKDPLCFYCFKGLLDINEPDPSDIVCSGDCWDQHLCVDYKWGCPPRGRFFGPDAYLGAAAFLVFKQPNDNYTIWGRTVINSVDDEILHSEKEYEDGFSFVHFDSFDPLPRDKWVRDISDIQLVGAKWLMGRHRYLDVNEEKFLDQLIEGEITLEAPTITVVRAGIDNSSGVALGTTISQSIYKKLEEMAVEDGRSINELVREAVATWIRSR